MVLLQFKSEPVKKVPISGWLVTLCSDPDKQGTFTLTDPVHRKCLDAVVFRMSKKNKK